MTPAVSPAGRQARPSAHHRRARARPARWSSTAKPVAVDGEVQPVPPRWISTRRLLLTVDGHFSARAPRRAGHGRARSPSPPRCPSTAPATASSATTSSGARGAAQSAALHLPALSPGRPQGRLRRPQRPLDRRHSRAAGAPRRVRAGGRHPVPARPPPGRPTARRCVYADDRDGLFAVAAATSAPARRRCSPRAAGSSPRSPPTATRLACLDMAGNLVVRDLADGTEKLLAAPLGGGGLPGRPSWSPDGRYLALCDRNRLNQRFREGYNLIRVVDTDERRRGPPRRSPRTPRSPTATTPAPSGPRTAAISPSSPSRRCGCCRSAPTAPRTASRAGSPTRAADHPTWSARLAHPAVPVGGHAAPAGRRAAARTRTVPVPLDHRRPRPADTVVHAGPLLGRHAATAVREDVDVLVRGRPHHSRRPAPRAAGPPRAASTPRDRPSCPGLWDSHTHPWQYTYGGRQTATPLAYGITTAVSLGGFAYEQARLREAVAAGALAGPRLLATGELLDGARVAYSMGRAHRTREGLRRSLARGGRARLGLREDVRARARLDHGGGRALRARTARGTLRQPPVHARHTARPGPDHPPPGDAAAGVRARTTAAGPRLPGRRSRSTRAGATST